MATAGLDADLAGGKVEFVMQHDDLLRRDLEEMRRFTDRLAGQVHVGLRLQRQCLGAAEDALGQFAVEPLAEGLETVLFGARIDRPEADVLPLPPLLGAGLAQSDAAKLGPSALAPVARGRPTAPRR